MSIEELERIIPVSPPMVKRKIKPRTHIIEGDIIGILFCRVAIQLNTFTPVGMAIIMVAVVK
jgi:hypothetical protein